MTDKEQRQYKACLEVAKDHLDNPIVLEKIKALTAVVKLVDAEGVNEYLDKQLRDTSYYDIMRLYYGSLGHMGSGGAGGGQSALGPQPMTVMFEYDFEDKSFTSRLRRARTKFKEMVKELLG